MNKAAYFFLLTALAFSAGAASLKWHLDEFASRTAIQSPATATPVCELFFDPAKLGSDPQKGFAIVAIKDGKSKEIPAEIFQYSDLPTDTRCSLAFANPGKVQQLLLYFNGRKANPAIKNNLFNAKWELYARHHRNGKDFPDHRGNIVCQPGGVQLKLPAGEDRINYSAVQMIDIPENFAGSNIFFSGNLISKAKLPVYASISFAQLDANGRVLISEAIDPRFLGMQLPVNKTMGLRQHGKLDPRCRKLRAQILVQVIKYSYGSDNKLLADPLADSSAVVEFTDLKLRAAERIDLPGLNPDLFAAGFSRKKGDYALNLPGKCALFYNNMPPGAWNNNKTKFRPSELHHPLESGTIEMRLNPEKWSKDSVTLFCTARQIRLSYNAPAKELTLQLSGEKDFLAPVKAGTDLAPGQWHHLAAAWNREGRIEIFHNGKKIASETRKGFKPGLFPPKRISDDRICAVTSIGTDFTFVDKLSRTEMDNKTFFIGRIDDVRVSDITRYDKDFSVPSKIRRDRKTRAYFSFDFTCNGTHHGSDAFINGNLLSEPSPDAVSSTVENRDGSKRKVYWSREIDPKVAPSLRLASNCCKKIPEAVDYKAAYRSIEQSFDVESGKNFKVTLPQSGVMDSFEITALDTPLEAPLLLKKDDVDPRSFPGIRNTAFKADDSDYEKAIKLFSYLCRTTGYFSLKTMMFPYGKNRPVYVPYANSLTFLNGYGYNICGELNFLTYHALVQAAETGANMTGGTGHSFQQAFYDNRWHLFDLSAQKYYVGRDGWHAASLEDIERDPYILVRESYASQVSHVIAWSPRKNKRWSQSCYNSQKINLRPGESLRINMTNFDKKFNDLSEVISRKEVWRDVTGEMKSAKKIGRISRVIPEFAIGELCYSGVPAKKAAPFSCVTDKSFCLKVELPLQITDIILNMTPACSTSISFDDGKTFEPFSVENARGRNGFILKFDSSLKNVQHLACTTRFQLNRKTVTGVLTPGVNDLMFLCDNSAKARITFSSRVRDGEIYIAEAAGSGVHPGFERLLLAASEKRSFKVNGISDKAVCYSKTIDCKLENGILTILPKEKMLSGKITVTDGSRRRTFDVICGKNVRLLTPENISEKTAVISAPDKHKSFPAILFSAPGMYSKFKFQPLDAGKYAVISLTSPPQRDVRTFREVMFFGNFDGAAKFPASCVTHSANAPLRQRFGTEKSRFKWDFAMAGRYPYYYPAMFKLNGADTLTITSNAENSTLAAVLIIPAEDKNLLDEIVWGLASFNRNTMEQ